MRLSPRQLTIIRDLAREHFGEGAEVYLFGSRVDDGRRGGDIDLFIDMPGIVQKKNEKTSQFTVALQRSLGEQRIDIVVRDSGSRQLPIHDVARSTGVRL